MGNRKRREAGPQQHAEGQHGEKTHRRLLEQLQAGDERTPSTLPTQSAPGAGGRRLQEGRQQHDPAEKNSERARE
jgi:hypothetical protein